MTEQTTVSALEVGARILVDASPGPVALAKTTDFVQVAAVTALYKAGRKRGVVTDLGEIIAGPTTRVFLAATPTPEEVTADSPDPDPLPAPAGIVWASVSLNAAGRVTPGSEITAGDRTGPVPPAAADGATDAPSRLAAALAAIGYEPAGRWALKNGAATCPVRPIHP
ncbi:hypothetical protein [Micromonospora sp. WMMD980]|uniref:hypothetical protein n=1 Tax=Micromonospora sp. WMMD980 TaxID=3016088 RepID=UPI002415CF9F|nr:hypothetical protein [Micromonospora sp. WMMD980]MDG4801753.1 hypothetical protein [Micromonospora sp. WMMD980]